MRYTFIRLKGYVGFYNGLQLKELSIDLSQSKNKIIVISGINGCGKSTLSNACNVFPDPSSSYMDGFDAEKELHIENGMDNYKIRISSPSASSGRGPTKAFIEKNGLELNTNGNITSYKEIIFNEFELDSNYIALSKLSGNDRGIGDKSPAERKKFATYILDNMQLYNDIYKTLNKKSLIFKSHINTLHTKIQNIGEENYLKLQLNGLSEQYASTTSTINSMNEEIVRLNTLVSVSQSEADEFQSIKDQKESLENEVKTAHGNLILGLRNYKSSIDVNQIDNKILEANNDIEQYQSQISGMNIEKGTCTSICSDTQSDIHETEVKIKNIDDSIDRSLVMEFNKIRKITFEQILELKNHGIDIIKYQISIDEMKSVAMIFNKLIVLIDQFYDGLSDMDISNIVTKFKMSDLENVDKEIESLNSTITLENSKLTEMQRDAESMQVLDNRPKKCEIPTCPFKKDALELKTNKYKGINLVKEIYAKLDKIEKLTDKLSKTVEKKQILLTYASKSTILDTATSTISINEPILNKIGRADSIKNITVFLNNVSNVSNFNDIRNHSELQDMINIMISYNENMIIKTNLEDKMQKQKSDKELKDELEKRLIELKSKYEVNFSKSEKFSRAIQSSMSILSETKSKCNILLGIKSAIDNENEKKSRLEEITKSYDRMLSKSSDAITNLKKISDLKQDVQKLQQDLGPISSQKERLSGQIALLESYKSEFAMYSDKANIINTLKKYCSPTGGGIQTIFMQLYMDKTLEISNQILSMIFAGEYHLLDFVINESEFRIPFVGSGLPVDDISSGSTSQICIMSMVINLVLLSQASTKFNIARLDEIDGGLDHRNRGEFVQVLMKVIEILGIDQLFIISHSVEIELSCADIIKLKTYQDFDNGLDASGGNVIYNYADHISETLN